MLSAETTTSTHRAATARLVQLAVVLLFFISSVAISFAEQRFPPPDFETGHQLPSTTTPPARAFAWEYVDVAVLAVALMTAVYLVYRKRSRKGLVALSLFSLAYFGFWRNGCVCSIGSFQNVAWGLFGSGYAVPVGVVLFFALPLMTALFAGRAFCAGVCPHGALQDLVHLKSVKVPVWLEQSLGVLPFIYLGAAVLFAATGSAFLVCQYDPFVPIFRMNGRSLMVFAGAGLLLLGVFVGRPYCRFLCPYGALLKLGAIVARLRVRVTPNHCTQCRLCEVSCPFGAMREPVGANPDPGVLAKDRRRLAWALLALPVLVSAGVWLGGRFAVPAAHLHPTVQVANDYLRERDQPLPSGPLSPDQLAVERARNEPRQILQQAVEIRNRFDLGGKIFGGWVGLVIAVKLISLALRRQRTDYEPDRGDCFACARCFEYCPNELIRRGLPVPALPMREPTAVPAGAGRVQSPVVSSVEGKVGI